MSAFLAQRENRESLGLENPRNLRSVIGYNQPTVLQESKNAPKPPDERRLITSAARYSEIGFIIPAAVIMGFFLGKLLDYWLHTHWIYLAGLIFGAVVGFVQMIRMAFASTKDK